MSSWKQLELFGREAQTLKQLDNPNICKYLDYFEEDVEGPEGLDKRFFIVQQLAEGATLEQLVRDGKRFSDDDLRHVLVELLKTCEYLSRLRPPVIHRDIKPSNVIVSDPEDVASSRVFLVDFGGVASAAAEDDMRMNTMTIVGTLDFMAPEQFRGRTSPLSDVYSAASTLLYIATRRLPSQFPEVRMRIDLREVEMDATLKIVLAAMLEPAVEDRLDARRALDVLEGRITGGFDVGMIESGSAESGDMMVGGAMMGGSRWSSGRRGSGHRSENGNGVPVVVPTSVNPQMTVPMKKPVGSRIEVEECDKFLRVTIPPAKFDEAAISVGGFALAWNAFVLFWTVSALAGGGIFMALFSAPFWVAGVGMIKTSISRQFMSEEIYLDPVSWRVSQRLAVFNGGKPDFDEGNGGGAKQKVGFVADIQLPVKVKVSGYVNDEPVSAINISHGADTIQVGEGLTEVEQAFVVGRINAWLSTERQG